MQHCQSFQLTSCSGSAVIIINDSSSATFTAGKDDVYFNMFIHAIRHDVCAPVSAAQKTPNCVHLQLNLMFGFILSAFWTLKILFRVASLALSGRKGAEGVCL